MIHMGVRKDDIGDLAGLSAQDLQEVLQKLRSTFAGVQQQPLRPLANEIAVGALEAFQLLSS